MKKRSSVIKNISYKNLHREIKGYGYEYKFSSFIFQIIIALVITLSLAYFYKLKLLYIGICSIIAIFSIPAIVIAQFRHLYNNNKFEQLVNYLDQMIISFKQTPKILFAMEQTVEFLEGNLKQQVLQAIDFIKNDTSSTNVYESAFNIIENDLPCSRLKTMHVFLLRVETGSSRNYQESLDNLYFDIRSWVTRTYQYQAELKNIKRKITIILGLSLAIAAVFSKILLSTESQLKGHYDFVLIGNPLYQIATTIFVVSFIVIFAFLNTKINGYWLIDDINGSKDGKVANALNYVDTYNMKKEMKKGVISSLIVCPILITGIVTHKNIISVLGIILIAILIVKCKTRYSRNRKLVERELIKEFPIWMRSIAVNLNDMVVVRAIEASVENSSFVMKAFLIKFLKEVDLNPDSISPYRNFLGIYEVTELSTAFKMLYSIKTLSSGESQRQINDLIERNQILLSNSERVRNEDSLAGTAFLSMFPMILLSFKLILDLGVMMGSFISITTQVL